MNNMAAGPFKPRVGAHQFSAATGQVGSNSRKCGSPTKSHNTNDLRGSRKRGVGADCAPSTARLPKRRNLRHRTVRSRRPLRPKQPTGQNARHVRARRRLGHAGLDRSREGPGLHPDGAALGLPEQRRERRASGVPGSGGTGAGPALTAIATRLRVRRPDGQAYIEATRSSR